MRSEQHMLRSDRNWAMLSLVFIVVFAFTLRWGTNIMERGPIFDERWITRPIADLIRNGWSVERAIDFQETKGPALIWPYAAGGAVLIDDPKEVAGPDAPAGGKRGRARHAQQQKPQCVDHRPRSVRRPQGAYQPPGGQGDHEQDRRFGKAVEASAIRETTGQAVKPDYRQQQDDALVRHHGHWPDGEGKGRDHPPGQGLSPFLRRRSKRHDEMTADVRSACTCFFLFGSNPWCAPV